MLRDKVHIKRLKEQAIIPVYGSSSAAGADLYACLENNHSLEIAPGETVMIPIGIAMEIPEGFVGLIYARSGLASKKGLAPANKVGVIDADYRGEIKVPLYNHSKKTVVVEQGERIAQIILMPFLMADFEECKELSNTERGENGFGSTGEK